MPVTINGTTGIAGVDGSAGTPSVQGTDTNTGMFFPAADTIAFSAGGTEDLRIGPAGQIGIQGANYGTSGQVLASGGASAAPSWTTISVSPSGLLIRAPRILTSGTSYTTPSNCTAIYLEMWGAGGGGAYGNSYGSGGGSGAYLSKYATVTGNTAYTYAIGSGGSGKATGSYGSGSNGGNTTFTIGATTYTAGGGSGGSFSGSTGSPIYFNGVSGGTATNGDINLPGMNSGGGFYNSGTGYILQFLGPLGTNVNSLTSGSIPTPGGSTVGPLITSSGGAGNTGQGGDATFYGAGGGGATGGRGGNGYQGLIRIWEYT